MAADPVPPPQRAIRLRPLAVIQQKLERMLSRTGNRALDRYRPEVGSIIEALDSINRNTHGMRHRGRLGDFELD